MIPPIDKQEKKVKLWPTWKQLNILNNIHFLKISYVVLIVVPLLALLLKSPVSSLFNGVPLTLKLGYFAALILSVAHMIYQGYCPNIIKRFDSPNDLYRDMLEIKALQSQYLPNDKGFTFHIAHCREGFEKANNANFLARLISGILYLTGIVLVGYIAIERTAAVLGS